MEYTLVLANEVAAQRRNFNAVNGRRARRNSVPPAVVANVSRKNCEARGRRIRRIGTSRKSSITCRSLTIAISTDRIFSWSLMAPPPSKGTANHVATAAEGRAWKGQSTNDSMRFLKPTRENVVPAMTKLRSWLLPVAVWIALVGVLLGWFTLTPRGGAPYWLVSLIVSWLPFVALVGVWIWFSRRNGRTSSGASWVDLFEQQVVEAQRTNALLERIAKALEKSPAG
jgi:hypothetical protein